MTNPYKVSLKGSTAEVTIKLPRQVVRDLVLRSEENGRDVNVEILLRLVRTLENDLEMAKQDRELAEQCYHLFNKGE